MKRIVLASCLALIAFGPCLLSVAQKAPLRAGAARVDITTPAEALPYLSNELPFVGVHDPVFTRALVLDNGATEVAIVVIDVTAIPLSNEMRHAVSEALGVPAANVLLAASHTHSSPLVSFHGKTPNKQERREIDRIQNGTLAAVREAKARLQPASVAFARGEGWVNVNNGETISLETVPDPRGESDKSLDVLQIKDVDGKALAYLLDYADHAEVMFHSVTRNGGYEITGDLPGVASKIIEDNVPGAPVVLFASGAGGNQLPIFKSLQPKQRLPAADAGALGWGVLDVEARSLANSALAIIDGMPAGAAEVKLTASSKMVSCPGKEPAKDSGQAVPPVQIPLGLIQINDIALATVAGDVGTEIGEKFKEASPLPNSTMITMTTGEIGYILGDSSYKLLTHGVRGSALKAGCAEQAIVQGLVGLIGKP